jgi:drug/metabolite transporter (DMT)-like permease
VLRCAHYNLFWSIFTTSVSVLVAALQRTSTNDSERQRTTAVNTSETAAVNTSQWQRTPTRGAKSPNELQGWIFTSIGVACFSLSFVTARLALRGFDPWLIALARGAGAGLVAVVCMVAGKYPLPRPGQIVRLCLAAIGIVFVFPIFTTIALQTVPASHAATIAAILPLLTALFGVMRRRERAPFAFWVIAGCGTLVVAWFLISRSNGLQLEQADLLIVLAYSATS